MALFLEIITNAADILILAFVIYKILILLKDNRAMQLIKGIVLLFVFYFISGWLHLDTINYILGQSWAALFIGIIIIFQPELRRLLEHLGGKGNFLNRVKKEPKERLLIDLMETLRSASKTKTGLLIVLEGKTGLEEYIGTGTKLDALVSTELLGNIFFKNSPLHDGAVIIRGNRIAAAGCIVPVSKNTEIESVYGTRHRAALGISEISDGMVLVVSEETGGVSVAKNGKLYRHVSSATVEHLLRDFFTNKRKAKKKAAAKGRK